MNIRSPYSFAALALLAMTQTGCVALNVPSQRYHDPNDHGGIFGPWSRQHDAQGAFQHCASQHCASQHCIADSGVQAGTTVGALEVDPFDTSLGPDGKPKPPEVPWPRFHPVPTRPVFGPEPY